MVFPRKKKSERDPLDEETLRSSGSSFNRIDSFDSDRRYFGSDSFDNLREARKFTSSASSLLSFGRRRKDSVASGSSSHAGSFGKWSKLENPLFRRSIVSSKDDKKALKAEKASKKKKEKESNKEKHDKKSRGKDNDERVETERKESKTRRASRLLLRRRKKPGDSIKQNDATEVLDILEKRVEDTNEPENTFTLYTKSGESVKVYFGHDYLSIDGRLILYEHIIYWGHTRKCLKVSYLENMSTLEQDRVDIALYPTEKQEVKAEDLANILQNKVALLYSELTGCSKDEAINVSTKCVTKRELNEVLDKVDETSERLIAPGYSREL